MTLACCQLSRYRLGFTFPRPWTVSKLQGLYRSTPPRLTVVLLSWMPEVYSVTTLAISMIRCRFCREQRIQHGRSPAAWLEWLMGSTKSALETSALLTTEK